MLGEVINGRYQILSELGSGGYGQVYKVQDLHHNNQKAIKFSNNHYSLLLEYNILKDLQGEGIPRLYKYGQYNSSYFLIMQLLGSNLHTQLRSNRIDSSSIPNILYQCLQRIEYVHNKNYIHRDIKPHQFVTGVNSNQIYLLDYGVSSKYFIDKCHIAFQSNCRFVGSCHFASMNAHIGIRLSRRDDLESFVYSAIFILTKTLPWIESSENKELNKWNSVFRCKREMLQTIKKEQPEELADMLSYVTSLKFEETPDYQYLRGLIRKMGTSKGLLEVGTKIRLNRNQRHSLREKSVCQIKRMGVRIVRAKSKTAKHKHEPSGILRSEKKCPLERPPSQGYASTNHNTSFEETEKGGFPEFSQKLRSLLQHKP